MGSVAAGRERINTVALVQWVEPPIRWGRKVERDGA